MASHSLNPDPVIAQVKRLILTQLKVVLRSFNLPVSGPKATLQQRIINRESQATRRIYQISCYSALTKVC